MKNLTAILIANASLLLASSAVTSAQAELNAAPVAQSPARPADMPPNPPKVTCSGDELIISAENSTLESILASVRSLCNAKLEIPPSAAQTRTFEQLGPGPVRRVLDQLLSGTEFDYVIQSSVDDPHRVEKVLLSERNKSDSPNAGPSVPDMEMTPARRAWLPIRQNRGEAPNLDGAPTSETSAFDPKAAASESQSSSGSAADANPADVSATAQAPAPVESANPPTTQDRITSMQQLFDQRRQMIQKQNTAQSSTPN